MKLLRFGDAGKEKPGVMIGDTIYNVSSFGEDFGESFFGSDGPRRLSSWVDNNLSGLPKVNGATLSESLVLVGVEPRFFR